MEEEFEGDQFQTSREKEKFERVDKERRVNEEENLRIFYEALPSSVSRYILQFFTIKELSKLCLVSKTMNSKKNFLHSNKIQK